MSLLSYFIYNLFSLFIHLFPFYSFYLFVWEFRTRDSDFYYHKACHTYQLALPITPLAFIIVVASLMKSVAMTRESGLQGLGEFDL